MNAILFSVSMELSELCQQICLFMPRRKATLNNVFLLRQTVYKNWQKILKFFIAGLKDSLVFPNQYVVSEISSAFVYLISIYLFISINLPKANKLYSCIHFLKLINVYIISYLMCYRSRKLRIHIFIVEKIIHVFQVMA